MALQFSWDQRKAQSNAVKHGISFEEAASAFGDPLSLTVEDPDHSRGEKRYILVGETYGRRLVFRKNELPYSCVAEAAFFRRKSKGGLSFQSFTGH